MATVIGKPERITAPKVRKVNPNKLDGLRNELEGLMETLPVDEKLARAKVFEIAAAMYENIGDADYETQRLKNILGREKPQSELPPELITTTITQVMVDGNGKVKIILKNQQILERGE